MWNVYQGPNPKIKIFPASVSTLLSRMELCWRSEHKKKSQQWNKMRWGKKCTNGRNTNALLCNFNLTQKFNWKSFNSFHSYCNESLIKCRHFIYLIDTPLYMHDFFLGRALARSFEYSIIAFCESGQEEKWDGKTKRELEMSWNLFPGFFCITFSADFSSWAASSGPAKRTRPL